jgi:hypothetical protein
MKKIVFIMEEITIAPNEIIFNEEEVADFSIYFI